MVRLLKKKYLYLQIFMIEICLTISIVTLLTLVGYVAVKVTTSAGKKQNNVSTK